MKTALSMLRLLATIDSLRRDEQTMRLIDADRLSEAIYDNVPAPYEDASWAKENCLAEIEAAQTVDAVPVVRCRECKHLGFCGDATNLEVMGFYGYCSRGERKEGADNG